jgi:hypothetical protein
MSKTATADNRSASLLGTVFIEFVNIYPLRYSTSN